MIIFHIISPLIWNTFQTDFNLPDNLNIQTIFPQLAKLVLPKVEVIKKVTGKRVALLSCFQFEIRRLFSQFDRSSFIYSSVSGYVKEATRRAGGEGEKKQEQGTGVIDIALMKPLILNESAFSFFFYFLLS